MAGRVKVAHIITRLELGGAQQNTLYCCRHHDRRKYEVVLITGQGGYLDAEAQKIKNLQVHFLPELKHPIRPWWDLRAYQKIASILKNERIDIVHTHSSKAGILGRWAAKKAGVSLIVHTVHGWGFFPGQFFPLRWLYQVLERWAAEFTNSLITVSQENKREGLAAGIGRPGQYQVIHSGIDPRQYRLSTSQAGKAGKKWGGQGRPTVLILSNFKKQKSPLDAVEAAGHLAREIPSVLFLWAGDGPMRGKVERVIREKGLEENFKLLGWREDVAELLAASDVLLLTSLHEGLPRVVLQAMAAGKPVVATDVNGTPEAVRKGVTGFLHRPHETSAMARSLLKLLQNDRLRRKMGEAGRKSLKGTFLIAEMLRQIERLYEKTRVKPSVISPN